MKYWVGYSGGMEVEAESEEEAIEIASGELLDLDYFVEPLDDEDE